MDRDIYQIYKFRVFVLLKPGQAYGKCRPLTLKVKGNSFADFPRNFCMNSLADFFLTTHGFYREHLTCLNKNKLAIQVGTIMEISTFHEYCHIVPYCVQNY
jgi:hypothetical protein